ncbi:MAG TPA: aquaporin, partial [Solirubrobacteraceae bacterium]|nr:aquaporin [Solirubrobacteraceae bacterium]
VAEALGTAMLVIVGVGVATLSFGFRLTGASISAGVVATALAFGFVLLALAYTLGPVSGANVNPAVTMGFVLSGRMSLTEAAGYWAAQFAGGIVGALVLWAIFSASPAYSRTVVGLGANGWGAKASMLGIGLGGAFATEVVLTYIFVIAVLVATSRVGSPGFAGLAIGVALTVVHLIGIPLTGTSVNPARSLGPAVILGGTALSQVWLFIVAPLLGGALAALSYRYFVPSEPVPIPSAVAEGDVERTAATPR